MRWGVQSSRLILFFDNKFANDVSSINSLALEASFAVVLWLFFKAAAP